MFCDIGDFFSVSVGLCLRAILKRVCMCLLAGVGLNVVIQCVSLAAVGVNVWCQSHSANLAGIQIHENGSEF